MQPTPSSHSSPDILPQAPRGGGGARRALQGVVGLGFAALAVLALTSGPVGCGGNSGTGGSGAGTGGSTSSGTFCQGGFVRMVMGKPTCEGLCMPSLCANPNNVCIDNLCAPTCTAGLDCPIGTDCVASKVDGSGMMQDTCQSNGKGQIGASCPFGSECKTQMTCGDGTPCPTSGSCTAGTCQALTCLTAGAGDADAYCTLLDCHTDMDCPGGYACDTIRDPHQICGGAMPDPNLCGTTSDPCVTPSSSNTYTKGQPCTQRNQCRKRAQCDPCTTDLDCSLVAGRHCAQGNCAADCASDADCVNGMKCSSGECVPRTGSCAPASPGAGKFCDPCRDEGDCGTGLLCAETQQGDMRVCLNLNAAPCTTDANCPKAASGLHAICADERLQLAAGQPGYHTCYIAPFVTADGKFGCWQGNKGAGCYVPTDCISQKCFGADAANQTPGACE